MFAEQSLDWDCVGKRVTSQYHPSTKIEQLNITSRHLPHVLAAHILLKVHFNDLNFIRCIIKYPGVEIRKLSLSVSSLISIFGLTSVQKIVLNQYKLSILALFTLKFLNFQ